MKFPKLPKLPKFPWVKKKSHGMILYRLFDDGIMTFRQDANEGKSRPPSYWKKQEDDRMIIQNLYESGITNYNFRPNGKEKKKKPSRPVIGSPQDFRHIATSGPATGQIEFQRPEQIVESEIEIGGVITQLATYPSRSTRVVMVSPHREDSETNKAKDSTEDVRVFSKKMLIKMHHDKTELTIDLYRPELALDSLPLHVLAPLCVYRNLRSLTLTSMMQSYQYYIWRVVWLNPQLTQLTLEMSKGGERLDSTIIGAAQRYALHKPTMRDVVEGRTTNVVSRKFSIVDLSLTNFVVDEPPFEYFTARILRNVNFHRCTFVASDFVERMKQYANLTVAVTA